MIKRQPIINILLLLLLYTFFAGVFSVLGYAWVPDVGPSGPVGPLPQTGGGWEPPYRGESTRRTPFKLQFPKESPTDRAWRKEVKKVKRHLTKEIIRVRLEPSTVEPQHLTRVLEQGRALFGFGSKGSPKFKAKIPIGKTPPTRFAPENLRRAISILGDTKKLLDMSPEDAKFITDQAGLAMYGAPLQVVVPLASESSRQRRELGKLVKIANEIERDIVDLQNITNKRRRLEDELLKIEEQIRKVNIQTSGKDPILPQARINFQQLKDECIKVREKENSARKDLDGNRKEFQSGVEQHFN